MDVLIGAILNTIRTLKAHQKELKETFTLIDGSLFSLLKYPIFLDFFIVEPVNQL